jgi:hypothetical protein
MRLWKLSTVVSLLCGLLAFRSAGIEFENKSLLGNKIEMKIPKDFVIMPEEMAKLKYIPERRPTLIYSNETGNISVALNLTNSNASQAQLSTVKDNLLYTYRHPYMGAKVKWDGMQTVNGRKVGFIEFGSGFTPSNTVYGAAAAKNGVYTLIFFTDFHGRLLLCTVSCTDANIEQWQPAAKEIMASLKLN